MNLRHQIFPLDNPSILINTINMKNELDTDHCVVTSQEACEALGVSRDTLYAYVSRGLLRAAAHPSDARKSLYDRRDVAELSQRKSRGRSRRAVAESTINWGEPVLTSKITRIEDGRFYYRGQDAVLFSEQASLEDALALLAGAGGKTMPRMPNGFEIPDTRLPFNRVMGILANEAISDRLSDGRPRAAQLLRMAGLCAAGRYEPSDAPVHEVIAGAWSADAAAPDLIRRALVLCADHELNASAYTARVAASAGASLPAALLAGIASLSGAQHGGMTSRCRDFFNRMGDGLSVDWRQQYKLDGKPPPGFGHPLYPDGDPRSIELTRHCPVSPVWRRIEEQVIAETGAHPTIDYALANMEIQLALPEGAGMGLFAAGRMAGWIAHIFEQRQTGQLIRPRAAPGG